MRIKAEKRIKADDIGRIEAQSDNSGRQIVSNQSHENQSIRPDIFPDLNFCLLSEAVNVPGRRIIDDPYNLRQRPFFRLGVCIRSGAGVWIIVEAPPGFATQQTGLQTAARD
ncbi:Uncharacterised protein [Brucella melitensis]|nr:Uncharacterised protein [Brucella melitensis]